MNSTGPWQSGVATGALRFQGQTFPLALAASRVTTLPADEYSFLGEAERTVARVKGRATTGFAAGRLAAKVALQALPGGPVTLVEVHNGVVGQPVVPSWAGAEVSIAHDQGRGVAIAFSPETPCGIDYERLDRPFDCPTDQFSDAELRSVDRGVVPHWLALWCTKEAVSKILRTGLTAPVLFYETEGWQRVSPTEWQVRFKHLPQWVARVVVAGAHVLAWAHPARTTVVGLEESWATLSEVLGDPSPL